MSAWTEFRDKLEDKIQQQISPAKGAPSPNAGTGAASGGIFEAIYQFGRGQVDTAIQTATRAIRQTSAGQKIEAEATRQKIQELMPMILLGIVAIIAGSYFFFHRR